MPYSECLEGYLAHYITANAKEISDVTEEFMREAVRNYWKSRWCTEKDNDCFVNVEEDDIN
jgi:hypothetical protein